MSSARYFVPVLLLRTGGGRQRGIIRWWCSSAHEAFGFSKTSAAFPVFGALSRPASRRGKCSNVLKNLTALSLDPSTLDAMPTQVDTSTLQGSDPVLALHRCHSLETHTSRYACEFTREHTMHLRDTTAANSKAVLIKTTMFRTGSRLNIIPTVNASLQPRAKFRAELVSSCAVTVTSRTGRSKGQDVLVCRPDETDGSCKQDGTWRAEWRLRG